MTRRYVQHEILTLHDTVAMAVEEMSTICMDYGTGGIHDVETRVAEATCNTLWSTPANPFELVSNDAVHVTIFDAMDHLDEGEARGGQR